jgi:hypothetical protein
VSFRAAVRCSSLLPGLDVEEPRHDLVVSEWFFKELG